MNFFEPILILIVYMTIAQGLLLTKSQVRSCLGEEVVFTCITTEGSSLTWQLIVTRDSNIRGLAYTFLYHHYETHLGRKTWLQAGFRVELELVSVEPVLISTLTANLTDIIIDAEVTCQQVFPVTQAQSGRFSLASVPSVPVQITDPLYEYGCMNFNVSLNWIPPHGNHQIDYYRLRINGQSHTIINGTSHIINFLPYSENITAEIDIVNCAGEGAESIAILTKGGCLELETVGINSSESSCMKPAGYQTIIECESGQFPEEFLSTCQEDGRWIPDTTGCSVGCPIPSFPNNITFMISNSKVHVELPTNFTRIGSEIQLFCGNQTNQKSASPVFTAICGGNGTWSPNLSHGHIQCMEDKQIGDVHTVPIHPGIRVHVIIGASTGCGVVILFVLLTCMFLLQKLCKKRRHNIERMGSLYPDINSEFQHKLGELDHGTNIPQYETISPLYDVIPDNNTDHSEIYLRMMSNNAYSESAKCIQ